MRSAALLGALFSAFVVPTTVRAQDAPHASTRGASPAAHDTRAYMVREGDTLSDVSERVLGDSRKWPELWANNPEITNPHWIFPGSAVRMSHDEPPQASKSPAHTGRRIVVPRASLRPNTLLLREQGYLDQAALQAAGRIVGSVEERMLLAEGDEVYLGFPGGRKVRPGQSYTLFRKLPRDETHIHPDASGVLVRILGAATVQTFDPKRGIARALIFESLDPIERGVGAAVMKRRFALVDPQPNQGSVDAKIVATLRDRQLIAHDNLVFVDVGSRQGVQEGNRFFVVKRGDAWRASLYTSARHMGATVRPPNIDAASLPYETVAELRVVHARPNTLAAVVIRSAGDVRVGDRAVMRKGF
ncbi:MAG: LysM peptidoglycan-binding domain-containing protein [Proteobacteria bacterium]|nr:LysM peptidoglycan-binding domain-containing protein [Pseudomonadota bacterium]